MQTKEKKIPYPQNLYLGVEVYKSRLTQEEIADAIGVSRKIVNETINGKYLGKNIVPKILEELAKETSNTNDNASTLEQ